MSAEGGHGLPEPFAHVGGIEIPHFVITSWAIILLLGILSYLATRNMKKLPQGLQNVMEFVVEGLFGFFGGIMGEERARKYGPFLATCFLYILLSNYSGLLPGAAMIPGFVPPTNNISITAGLAILVFLSVFYFGIRAKGIGFFKHFFQPMAFLFILNIIEELVRPVSLSLRLYGNIFGEEMIIAKLSEMVPVLVPVPMMLLGVLTGAIQAFVFTLLATTYIAGATDEHH
ncbi:ATP synthase F0 subunit A [Thermincola ferriacetica]|uniref:ATP synthase subunit a n=2 Tax=Thermincola TaxID=278993 RepID=D5XDH9_THEPJ|nr:MULTISPECIES: F0F1 ATP synthase subunit A [Thermincola]ADG83725.1 ATP synthase F0, A subunit [Thermincola potens JR]KNZ68406.1 ATP synthase F0 subunit A [Thermincola ferriacetica]